MKTQKLKTEELEKENIKVYARFRPLHEGEENAISIGRAHSCVNFFSNHVEIVDTCTKLNFSFDYLFQAQSTQEEVFSILGETMICDIFKGYNGTIFAYGSTGSGKTHTMMGKLNEEMSRGIIPRCAELICKMASDINKTFSMNCSSIEIYREKLKDLISPKTDNLKIKENSESGIYIEGIVKSAFKTKEELISIFQSAENLRTVAATKLNKASSRSHFLLIIEVSFEVKPGLKIKGRLNLIDLAGSEKISRSEVSGTTLEEAKKINLSLSVLGKVICALSTNSRHIPYRDSKLTRLLQNSLGGNSKTSLIVNCSSISCSIDETISTLRFSQRAKTIKNCLKINREITLENELKSVKQELIQTKKELTRLRHLSLGNFNHSNFYENEEEKEIKELEMQIMQNDKEIIMMKCENKELKSTYKRKKQSCQGL